MTEGAGHGARGRSVSFLFLLPRLPRIAVRGDETAIRYPLATIRNGLDSPLFVRYIFLSAMNTSRKMIWI